MKLPIPFFKEKKEPSVYYLALLLTSEKASAVILEESFGKIKIISRQNQFFIENIEDLSLEELINTADKVISRAEEILPPNVEIRKTVFGVKENWVEEETKKIKKNYLQKLKKLCDSLDLSPIGFMVASEAISSLCQQKEGAPLSAVFVELGKKVVTLTLFRGGRSIQTTEGVVEDTYAATVDMLLKHFTIEVLPARIILYDTEISEDLVQQFIGHQWSKSLPFLHMPQISVLPMGFDAQALTYGAATQMGFEMTEQVTQIRTYEHTQDNKLDYTSAPKFETSVVSETMEHTQHSTTSTPSIPAVNFGFVLGEDIGKSLSDKHGNIQPVRDTEKITTGHPQKVIDEKNDVTPTKNTHPRSIRLPKIKLPVFPPKGFKILIIPLFIILVLGGMVGGAYYFYFYKVSASVLVTFSPKKAAEEREIIFTAENDNDFSNNVLGAKTVKGSLDGDMVVGATGKKDVGEKAKGTVTIYNNNIDSTVTLPSGTTIKSDNGLEFTLNKDVKVASASGDIFSGTKPGTASQEVTASDIGTNYNLPSGAKFSVTGQASLAAKNDSAFSGGSKKTITVISKDDLAKLKTELLKNLEDKATEQLTKQTQQDRIILPIVLSTNIEKTKYDKNAGDEAKSVKLAASISYAGLSYQAGVTKNFAKEILQKKYAKAKTFDENSINITIKDAKQKSPKEITATLIMNAALLPRIDKQGIARQLSGKSFKEAEAILYRIPQIEGTQVRFSPNISFLSKLLPRLPNHVTIAISSN